MASPFEYEDLMSEKIESLKVHNNQYDPTGKFNELRLPPKRKQQAAARPKFYNPEQQYARALPLPIKFSLLRPSSSTLTKLTHEFQLNIPPSLRHPLRPAHLLSDPPCLLSHPNNPHAPRQPSRRPAKLARHLPPQRHRPNRDR
jgi:hypothetical protein